MGVSCLGLAYRFLPLPLEMLVDVDKAVHIEYRCHSPSVLLCSYLFMTVPQRASFLKLLLI